MEPADLDQAPEQSPIDIFQRGADEDYCISGVCKMAWSHPGRRVEIIASITHPSTSEKQSFRLFFQLNSKILGLDLKPHDEFRLSLRGVEVEKLDKIPQLSTLPIQLSFMKGVNIRWRHQGPDSTFKVLNTWCAEPKSDGWFSSEDDNVETASPSSKKRKHEEIDFAEPKATSKSSVESKSSKKRQRLEAKRQKVEAAARAHSVNDVSANAEKNELGKTAVEKTTFELMTGLRVGPGLYSQITDIQKAKQCVSLIGIVVGLSKPSTTLRNDWTRFVKIVDPSNHQLQSGFKINCFTKRYKEWLPHPEIGDVLILRDVKIAEHNGALIGTGYSDKLRWAAFSQGQGKIHHGPPSDVPKQEVLEEHLATSGPFSPFFHPESPVIQYCLALSDWGREKIGISPLSDFKNAEKPVPPTKQVKPSRRVHRLISEAGPQVPPCGYFDCTVEVLKGFPCSNLGSVYTLFVTDYTRNDLMRPVQSNWCPPSLSEYVLQFEMWEMSAAMGRRMLPGQFYSIRNARMKLNSAGYLEGKIVEPNIVQLTAKDSSSNMNLKSLLKRRQNWESKKSNWDSDISHQLIQDVIDGKFFHCTVELLHAVFEANQNPHIFVTDYTTNFQLEGTAADALWSNGLNGRIVKISLSDEQRYIAEANAGSFFAIKKLRLKYSPLEGRLCGSLGGNEKLIHVLNPNKADNERLNGLLRRKEDWMNRLVHKAKAPTPPRKVPQVEIRPLRIKDISLGTSDRGTCRIHARVVDFYPLKLHDAFYQQCSHCNTEIPIKCRACLRCIDLEHEYVQYLYQLYIMLEDEDGDQIKVSINDECSLLAGLKRSFLPEDDDALSKLFQRLEPLLGNLTAMHDGLESGEMVDVDTPLMCFDLYSWIIPGGERAFVLIKHENLL